MGKTRGRRDREAKQKKEKRKEIRERNRERYDSLGWKLKNVNWYLSLLTSAISSFLENHFLLLGPLLTI